MSACVPFGKGGYRYLPAVFQYSSGVAAEPGFEIERARLGRREIEVELEMLSAQATRMRVVARDGGLFSYDGATATEIIVQTEKGLGV